jgi:hypothetical protein
VVNDVKIVAPSKINIEKKIFSSTGYIYLRKK